MKKKRKRDQRPLRNVMLWIGDLKQLRPGPELGVETFSVMGVIVDVIAPADLEESRRPVAYHVDDGTGVLKVSHFMRNRLRELNAAESADFDRANEHANQQAKEQADPLARRAALELEAARSAFPIGTCVEAKGRLQEFRGRAELLAFSVRRVDGAADEVARMETVARLKREAVYPENLRARRRPAHENE